MILTEQHITVLGTDKIGDVPNLVTNFPILVQQRMQRAANVVVAPLRKSLRPRVLHLLHNQQRPNALTFLKAGMILMDRHTIVLITR